MTLTSTGWRLWLMVGCAACWALACEPAEPSADGRARPAPQGPPAAAEESAGGSTEAAAARGEREGGSGGPDAPFPGCPEGTEEESLTIAVSDTAMRWCEKAGRGGRGVRHGPWRKRVEDRVVEAGEYQDGEREGRWTLRAGPDLVQEGEYRDGRRVGVWVIRTDAGEETRRVDYADGGTGVAPPDDSAGGPEPTGAEGAARASRLRIDNARSVDIELVLEPGGEALPLPAGGSVELRMSGAGPGELAIETADDALVLRAGAGGELTASGAGDVPGDLVGGAP